MDVKTKININIILLLEIETETFHAAERMLALAPSVHADVYGVAKNNDTVKRFRKPGFGNHVEVLVPNTHKSLISILAKLLVTDDKRTVYLSVRIRRVT